MQPNELVNGPRDLLILAIGSGAMGAVLILVANLIMKAIGMDLNEHVRETSRYRNAGFVEQMTAFHSDARNIPPAIGVCGLFLLFGAMLLALGAGAWFLVLAVSR